MNESLKEKLKKLIEEGLKFNYRSFCVTGAYGYPASYTSEYISWKTRMQTLLESKFGGGSAVFSNFKKGENIPVLGNGPDYFDKAHAYFMGALKSALDLLDFDEEAIEEEIQERVKMSNKVFIVHGHDENLKQEVEIFLKEIGLEPIVLHRQPDKGQTVIEKIENNSDVGYAIILLTPDDIGYPSTEESKEEIKRERKLRARQNVIFEFGYFIGKLGRNRVCCLYKENIELPTDIAGLVYKKITEKLEEAKYSIIKDLKAIGYSLKI